MHGESALRVNSQLAVNWDKRSEVTSYLCDTLACMILLQNVKEGQPLPSSPEAWGSYEETNSKRADIKTLILNFDKWKS